MEGDKMAVVYSEFARVYDELMDNAPYGEWCENIAALMREYGISRPVRTSTVSCPEDSRTDGQDAFAKIEGDAAYRTGHQMTDSEALLASERNLVLDLGCGTGTLTELLSQKGYDMIGVDNSPQMLEIAMEKRAESGSETLYLLQDMRELELYSTVGTVISVCDSLNYLLKEEDLLQVFRLVDNYLYPGGLFLFDFNTVYKYSRVIGDTVIAENRDDCSFIWENYYHEEEEINEYDLTVFVQQEGDHFQRFTENHFQRGYTPETMRRLVEQAGMQVVRLLDADSLKEVNDQSERVYLLARECNKKRESSQKNRVAPTV